MTAKEFIAKHYGSLSAGVFALGLLGVLGVYGGGFTAMGGGPADPATAAQQAPAVPAPAVSPDEAVPDEPTPDEATDETAEDEKDPLEQAMADEQAKVDERREQVREQLNKDREAAGLPLLPAVASDGQQGQ